MIARSGFVCKLLWKRQLATAAQTPRVNRLPNAVKVKWPDQAHPHIFHNVWLRDHCRCSECLHTVTQQRLNDTYSIDLDIKPRSIAASSDALHIRWQNHVSKFEWDWLFQHTYSPRQAVVPSHRSKILWRSSDIVSAPPEVSYNDVMSDDRGVLQWLQKIDEIGFCYVKDTPVSPEDTEQLVRRIAFIQETHYGAFWDFTADLAHGDTAYTDIALGAHTDTTYFSVVCSSITRTCAALSRLQPTGLQLFHMLSPPGSHVGGDSLLVDGLGAALRLRQKSPALYRILSTLPIPTHASGGPETLIKPLVARPVFEHDTETGELVCIRWNSDDRAPIGNTGPEWHCPVQSDAGVRINAVEGFYLAAKAWEDELRSAEAQYWTPYVPGRPFIFDNRRVLHGRGAFTGQRRMCGAYITGDDYASRLRTLERKYSIPTNTTPAEAQHTGSQVT